MKHAALLVATLACGACALGQPDYVVRYDLEQIAYDTAMRDASPGFSGLPDAASPPDEGTPAA